MKTQTQSDDIIKLLIECRTERGLSLEEAAKAVHLSAAGLSNIERGLAKPRRTTRLRLENFLRKHGYFPKTQEAA